MSTTLDRVQAALQMDVTVAAQQMAQGLDTFDPEKMSDADVAALVDRGTVIATGLRRLTEERAEINRGFDELKKKTTAKLSEVIEALTKAKARAGDIYTAVQRIRAAKAEEERREQARLAALAAEAAAKEAASQGEDAPPPPPPAEVEVEQPKNTVRGGLGQASGRKVLAVKVVDVVLVAKHYPHLLELRNAEALQEVRVARMRNPEAKLPGLEWWLAEGQPSFGARRK